jgi:hypothetical protein
VTRGLLLTVIAVGLVASAGWGVCVGAGWNPHRSSLMTAAAVTFVAALLAFVPLWLARASDQLAVAQAALVSTMIHLFVATGACGVVLIFKSLPHTQSFVYWVMAFYFATLIVVATTGATAVRNAKRVSKTSVGDVAPAASGNRE